MQDSELHKKAALTAISCARPLQGYLPEGLIGQVGAAPDDGELVARILLLGEDVHEVEGEAHGRP